MLCAHDFKTGYHFVEIMCPITFKMEQTAPGSSYVTAPGVCDMTGPLPTVNKDDDEDAFSTVVMIEYVNREIYHSCVKDKQNCGSFWFIAELCKLIKRTMDEHATEYKPDKDEKVKIYEFLKSLVFEDELKDCVWLPDKHKSLEDERQPNRKSTKKKKKTEKIVAESSNVSSSLSSEELLRYVDSHLICGNRWLNSIESHYKTNEKQEIQSKSDLEKMDYILRNFETVDIPDPSIEMKVLPRSEAYRKARATSFANIKRPCFSLNVRLKTWWETCWRTLNNHSRMSMALRNSLLSIFGLKSTIASGFKLNINYRFENTPLLSMKIQDVVCRLVGDKTCFKVIGDQHKHYIRSTYEKSTKANVGYIHDGIKQTQTLICPPVYDLRQSAAKRRRNECALEREKEETLIKKARACAALFRRFNGIVDNDEEDADNKMLTPTREEGGGKNEDADDDRIIVEIDGEVVLNAVYPNNNDPVLELNCEKGTTTVSSEETICSNDTTEIYIDNNNQNYLNEQSQRAVLILKNNDTPQYASFINETINKWTF